MKLITIFLFALVFQVHARTMGQTVTYSGKSVPLQQVLTAIREQTGFTFFYDKADLDLSRPVSLQVKNASLPAVLKEILADQPLDYEIQGKTIFITRKAAILRPKEIPEAERLIIIADFPVRMRIVNSSNEALGGATVTNTKTKHSVISDAAGMANLDAKIGDVYEVSFIGYKKRAITIQDKTAYHSVVLAPADSKLDEVQIIAYGTTSKRLNTGSVVTVTKEEIEKQPVMNPLLALQGKVPGLIITPTSGSASSPVKIELRGRGSLNKSASSEPLIVIDGVPQSTVNFMFSADPSFTPSAVVSSSSMSGLSHTGGQSPLFQLNPADIESIDVLMDGDATAIYGSRGANGVLLITTRKARPGKTRFNVNVEKGLVMMPSRYPRMLNISEYLAMRREGFKNDGVVPTVANAPDLTVWDTTRNVDWIKELLGVGSRSAIAAAVSGGDANSSFSLSTNYTKQVDLFNRNGSNQRGTVNFSFQHSALNKKLTMGLKVNYGTSKVDAVNDKVSAFSLPPNAPDIYDAEGKLNWAAWHAIGQAGSYPFGYILAKSIMKTSSLNASFNLGYEIVKGLKFNTNFGYSESSNTTNWIQPIGSQNPYRGTPTGTAQFGNTNVKGWVVEPQLSYNRFIGKGNFSLMAAGSLQRNVVNTGQMYGYGYTSDEMLSSINNAPATGRSMSAQFAEYKYVAFFSRLSYNWDQKYIMNINFRRDGSSRFAPGKQFGNFGSLGLAWIASDEEWISKHLPQWMTFIKFRGSYGMTGSDAIGDYQYMSEWAIQFPGQQPMIPYNGVQPIAPIHAVNQVYQWEDVRTLESALSLGFLEDKITMELAWYRKRTSNQLTRVPTSLITGFTYFAGNWVATVENSGITASLTATLIRKKDFSLNASFNIGVNKNKLISYPGLETSAYSKDYRIGESLNMVYVYKYLGVDPMTGLYAFEDYNKDGRIVSNSNVIPGTQDDDRYIALDMTPKYAGGFSTNARYKSISLSLMFSYAKQMGAHPYASIRSGMINRLYAKEFTDNQWKQPGDKASYGRAYSSSLNTFNSSDRAYINTSFLRLNTVALSYSLPEKLIRKAGMQSCDLSVNVQNVYTLTKFGLDPELGSSLTFNPVPRTMVARLSINF